MLAPGTLVEEAALRREILVASDLGDTAKFQLLSRQYLSRFRHSVYAGNFRQRFAAALTRMDFMNDEAEFHRLDELLVDLDPAAQLEVYLTVARASTVHGNLVAARLASERALALAEPGAADAARARLYRGSALVVAADGLDPALEDLQTVDTTMLSAADRALFNAASLTATSIQTAADPGAIPPPAAPPAEAAPAEESSEEEALPIVGRAQEALAAVDTLLEKAQQ